MLRYISDSYLATMLILLLKGRKFNIHDGPDSASRVGQRIFGARGGYSPVNIIAALAGYMPGRQAANVDPMVTLRDG
jgi:hypothetical protein